MGCTLSKKNHATHPVTNTNGTAKVLDVKPSDPGLPEVPKDQRPAKRDKKENSRPRVEEAFVEPKNIPSMDQTQPINKSRRDKKHSSLPRPSQKAESKRSRSFNRPRPPILETSRSVPRLDKTLENDPLKNPVASVSLAPKKVEPKPILNREATPAPSMQVIQVTDDPHCKQNEPFQDVRISAKTQQEVRAQGSPQRELQRTPRHRSTPPRDKDKENLRRFCSHVNINLIQPALPARQPINDPPPRESPDDMADRQRIENNIRERMHARHRARQMPIDPEEDTLFEVPPRMPVIDLVRI